MKCWSECLDGRDDCRGLSINGDNIKMELKEIGEMVWTGFIVASLVQSVLQSLYRLSCRAVTPPDQNLNEPNFPSGIQLKYGRDSIARICAGNVNLHRNSGLWIESPVCKS